MLNFTKIRRHLRRIWDKKIPTITSHKFEVAFWPNIQFYLSFFSGNRFLFGLGFVNSWSILDINIYICCHECPLKFFILIIAHSEIFKIVCNSKIPSHEFRFHEIFDIKSWPISGYDIGIFVKILQFRLVYLWIHGQFWILILQFVAMNGECPQKFHFLFNFQNRALKSWSSKTMSSKFL